MEWPERNQYMNANAQTLEDYGNGAYATYLNNRTFLPYFFVLFLISPVLALISAMANFRHDGAKLAILLFISAYGYTFILIPGKDAYGVAMTFAGFFQYITPTEFLDELKAMASLGVTSTTSDEPYIAVLAYLLAQFTADTSIFMMIVAFIFGIAYVKGISLVYEEREDSWNIVTITLFVLFISWVGLSGINHPRGNTGGLVFFAGAYLYMKHQDFKYLFIVLLAPLVHFMFLLLTVPFFVYVIFKDQKYIYISVLALSFVATAGLPTLETFLTSTELGADKVESYTGGPRWDPNVAGSAFDREKSFHAEYYRSAGRGAVQILFLFSLFFAGYVTGKHHDRLQSGLASVAILMYSLSNFTTAIPALSGRTMNYFGLFAIAYLLRLYSKKNHKLKAYHWLFYLCFPAILLFLFTQYSKTGDYTDFRILVSPLLYPFIGDDPVSIKEFLRTILDL